MIQVLEPATAGVMAEIPQAGVEETDAAVARAKEAFPGWRAVTPADRSALLHRLANALEVGVRVDDVGRLPAQLERDPLDSPGRPLGDLAADLG